MHGGRESGGAKGAAGTGQAPSGDPGPYAAALLAALFMHSPFSVALYDARGRVVAANPAYERHWGIRLADVPPDYSLFDDPQLEASGLLSLIRRAYDGEYVELPPIEYDPARATGGPGRKRWTEGHCYPVRDESGRVMHVAILHSDVTARVEAREALRNANADLAAEREALRRVIAELPAAVAVYEGPELRIRAMSSAYRRVIGGRDVLGLPIREALPELSGDEDFFARIEQVYATGESFIGAGLEAHWDGDGDGKPESHLVDVVYAPLRRRDATGGPGAVQGVIALVSDVADRMRLLEAERAAREAAEDARHRAEEANLLKGQFLAMMSHELRTPLNAIAGHVQLMELGIHGPLTEAQRGALGRVARAQHHLLGIINDVLNYARLESGRVEYHLEPVLASEVVADVAPMIEPQLRAKGLSFELRLPEQRGEPPVRVWADRDKLGQVLLNLLSNAVKFTPGGGRVTIELAERAGADMPEGIAFLRVKDTGIGIPRDKLESVFEPFVQLRLGYAQPGSGTGLGLAISRDLARGMGGDLRARSVEGKGSSFTVTLRRVEGREEA